MPALLRTRAPGERPSRRLALLGGTTTWGDCAAAVRLLAGGGLVDGPALAAYEREFADRIGVAHAVSFAHGRVALYGVLRALGVGPGDEVLVPLPTHVVVANAVRYTGATPVFADCRADSWNIDMDGAERLVTERTRALILQHTFGTPADIDRALELGRRHGVEVVEDCVHALGARHRDRPVGSFGRAAFFSTEETKTISSTMGGMAVSDDGALAASLRAFQARCSRPARWLAARHVLKLLGYHVLTQPRVHPYTRALYERLGRRNPLPGPTSPAERRGERPADLEQRLSNAQALLALRQLRRLDDNLAHRRRIAGIYAERLAPLGAAPPAVIDGDEPALVRYPLSVPDRQAAARRIAPSAVPGLWFTSVLEEAQTPAHGGYAQGSCPVAEDAARRLVNLPTHPRVRDDDAERIAAAAATALRAAPAVAVRPGASA
jgi:dTDP-4-amino-4,6-dideoxygalactose transaminase